MRWQRPRFRTSGGRPLKLVRRVVFTGGPGAGKTALLRALHGRGHVVVDETARAIIRSRLDRALSPRPAPLEFAQLVLQRDIDQYDRPFSPSEDVVFFDRGILDALCMLDQVTPLRDEELHAWVSRYPYHRQAFFLPPWEAIYTNDPERDQTFEEAVRAHRTLTEWYRRCRYDVVEVPRASIEERCAFVLRALGQDA